MYSSVTLGWSSSVGHITSDITWAAAALFPDGRLCAFQETLLCLLAKRRKVDAMALLQDESICTAD